MATRDKVTGKAPRPFTQLDVDQVSNVRIPAKNKKFIAEHKKAQASQKKKGGK